MIANHLKQLIDSGLTKAEISRATGIKQPCISRIITGKQKDVHYEQGKRIEALAKKVNRNG